MMPKTSQPAVTTTLAILFLVIPICTVSAVPNQSKVTDFWHCSSPTDGFGGLNDSLAPVGIEFGLSLTTLYQSNVHGGLSTNDKRGRYASRYDLTLTVDTEKLFGIDGGSLFIHGQGGWPDTEGIDGHSIGSAFGVNALAGGNRSMDITEFFYEGPFFSDSLTIAIGKLDFTGIFDAVEYADDECCQFSNGSFVDNPSIPFSDPGLGIVLRWSISDSWYLMGGISDAQADSRETGFRTTFHQEDYFFYCLETGKTIELDSANGLMSGTYRFGLWVDGQDKVRFSNNQNHRDDIGFYTSCDQLLYKETSDPNDVQGLGGFFRYGFSSSKYNSITNFFSFGFQYHGLFDGRDDDVFGIGYSRGFFSDADSVNYPEDYESAFETYYNIQLTPYLSISPSVQYIVNPSDGAGTRTSDSFIIGVRVGLTF